ncbi:cytochrome P450 4g15-like [Daphnia pulex]|uniref:cytochrome P450 4g15-like n=1 Tax=Daphnia pulex TaxID=6669 RepID=UPI001EDCE402|nr:cytochrome P450 4g15-like [Daphnia pulex]
MEQPIVFDIHGRRHFAGSRLLLGVVSLDRFVRLIDAMPGPKPLPILGNLLDVANIPLDEIVLSVSRYNNPLNNPIYKLWIGFYPAVVVAHPELWKPILSSHKLLARPHEYKFYFPENSLTNLTGEIKQH